MNNITNNEMLFVLSIFKSPELEYNANKMAKHIGISSMGALKIARRLEKENLIVSKEFGKAKFYRLNFDNEYTIQYIKFLLKRESEQAQPYIKVWISEIKKIRSANAAILFGSILRKHQEAKDIDVILITDKKRFSKLEMEVEEINKMNLKRLHPIYQTKEDFIKNIKKGDKVLIDAIGGIVVLGEDMIIELLQK